MTEVVDPDWCWSCGRTEPIPAGSTPYEVCYECGHVYATAKDLRRAYQRALWWTTGGGLRWRLWRILTVRTEEIFFCQECIHDF